MPQPAQINTTINDWAACPRSLINWTCRLGLVLSQKAVAPATSFSDHMRVLDGVPDLAAARCHLRRPRWRWLGAVG